MKKIVHIIPSLNRGGAERFVVDLCNELSDTEQVFLLSMYDNDDNSFVKELSNKVTLVSFGKKPGFDLNTLLRVNSFLRKLSPQVVNSHINALEYLIPSIYFLKSVKFCHTLHSIAGKEAANKWIIKLRTRLFRKRVLPITISNVVQNSFSSVYGFNNRDVLILNGRPNLKVNRLVVGDILEMYRVSQAGKLFLNVGRITPVKNQVNLVEAFVRFNGLHGWSHSLVILGDVQDVEVHSALVAAAEVSRGTVFILGGKSNVADYLEAADAFCLASLYEGMPISLIEAFCLGCVPLCTPVGGILDMIEDGVSGYLAKGVEVNQLHDNFNRFLQEENLEKIKAHIRNLYQQKYHIKITANNYLKNY